MHTGRDDRCPCGSQKRYDQCCLPRQGTLNKVFAESIRALKDGSKQRLREQKFGKVRPIIHANHNGFKGVAVGDTVHFSSRWNTMTNFLYEYPKIVFGDDWWIEEDEKPRAERHQILCWFEDLYEYQRKHIPKDCDKIHGLTPNGPMFAFLSFAYALYVLRDNRKLQESIVKRMKHKDQFEGARYELFVASTFIRAGFNIEYENETDNSSKHPEFIATHKETGQIFAVEAKKRQRSKIPTKEELETENVKLGITKLAKKALAKNRGQNFIVFLDLNLPPVEGKSFHEKPWFNQIFTSLKETGIRDAEGFDNYNLMVLTNHPLGDGIDDWWPEYVNCSLVPIKPKIPVKHPQALEAVINSIAQAGQIPSWFEE